jgi:hypothetical protein
MCSTQDRYSHRVPVLETCRIKFELAGERARRALSHPEMLTCCSTAAYPVNLNVPDVMKYASSKSILAGASWESFSFEEQNQLSCRDVDCYKQRYGEHPKGCQLTTRGPETSVDC